MNDNPCGVRFEFQLNESVCSAAYSTEHCSEARWDQDNELNKRKLTCTKITLPNSSRLYILINFSVMTSVYTLTLYLSWICICTGVCILLTRVR